MGKKFHLFIGDGYYPSSGLGDYVGSYETYEEAERQIFPKRGDWYTIAGHQEDGSLEELYHGWYE